jgi:hypothetical protein
VFEEKNIDFSYPREKKLIFVSLEKHFAAH